MGKLDCCFLRNRIQFIPILLRTRYYVMKIYPSNVPQCTVTVSNRVQIKYQCMWDVGEHGVYFILSLL